MLQGYESYKELPSLNVLLKKYLQRVQYFPISFLEKLLRTTIGRNFLPMSEYYEI